MQQQNDNYDGYPTNDNHYNNHFWKRNNYKNFHDNRILFKYLNQRDDNDTYNNFNKYLTYRTSQRSRRNFPGTSIHQMV
jgi:hypothetical protein